MNTELSESVIKCLLLNLRRWIRFGIDVRIDFNSVRRVASWWKWLCKENSATNFYRVF